METDTDPVETQEWLEAYDSVLAHEGPERARFLVKSILQKAIGAGVEPSVLNTPYCNTISLDEEAQKPDDQGLERRIKSLIRWNAVAMVLKAGKYAPELGGHIATYASAAQLYETGFNYFFHAPTDEHPGDLIYIQGHSSPGIYARAFLEGRLSEEQLAQFRQEVQGHGLSSYPHSWLMPDFWQFATVSMGLGPLQAIYQARFLRYLEHRGLIDNKNRKVWAFLGDGEMDEPESLGALSIAARERLDNLIFVINCNLQRLDGPVRGNGQIIQELERFFLGAGWNVIKLIWGANWDPLFAKDKNGLLLKRMSECVDGEYQHYKSSSGAYIRKHFFGKYPELLELVKDMTDDELVALKRGGHDPQKVYAAYHTAVRHTGQPTVVLVKTVKGYGMGEAGEAMNITHQQKKMSEAQLATFAKRFNIPLDEKDIVNLPFHRPNDSSPEMQHLKARRAALGGYLPARRAPSQPLPIPPLRVFELLLKESGARELSTTMAFVRILGILLKDKALKDRIVPIVPDESRTFGMEGLFRQIGIYSPLGQLYEPQDRAQLMYYREDKKGQLLEEGISEAGAFASWIAAATSYSTNSVPMIPFYIYYSMFGFQRTGDLAWAAGDMRARGFLLGGTAGKTTLAGEGLQHDDGHSLILSSMIPNCISYDPTYAYELAVIIHHGLERMYQREEDVYFYITLMNENYTHPSIPEGTEEGIIKGMYRLKTVKATGELSVHLLGSGTILREVEKAADLLSEQFNVTSDVWSVTSFTELRREGLSTERANDLNPDQEARVSYVATCLSEVRRPVIAATDYVKLYADQIRPFVPGDYYVLGTEGFGLSDTRERLRHHFEVDAKMVAYQALVALMRRGQITKEQVKAAQTQLAIDPNKPDPMYA